jgi:large subunit ribosomal protein L32
MPVPKRRKSSSKSKMRHKANMKTKIIEHTICNDCGKPKMKHHLCVSCGKYGSKKI